MDDSRRKERLKQLVQVLIDKKNSGKQVGSIAKMANMGVRDFKNISYKFKACIPRCLQIFSFIILGDFRDKSSFFSWATVDSAE